MNKRLTALLLLVALLLAAVLLPENGQTQSHSVVHQHEVWPQESEEATGFDVYGNLTTHLPLLIVQVNGRLRQAPWLFPFGAILPDGCPKNNTL